MIPRGFDPPMEVLASISPERLEWLAALAADLMAILPWGDRLAELGYSLEAIEEALERVPAVDEKTIFDPFEGHWVGGDIHDAARAFHHIWYPAIVDGDLVAQPVLMVTCETGSVTRAYNLCLRTDRAGGARQICGLVGTRAHLGFSLEYGGLLWIGEESEGRVSVHAEKVSADGQLYDVRGLVARVDSGEVSETIASDWRYHRVRPGAVRL